MVTDEYRAPMDLNVLAVYPHAHYLAKLIEGYATLPDGSKKWLIRIPDWDLNWQGVFRYKSPRTAAQGLGGYDAHPLRQFDGQRAQSEQPAEACDRAEPTRPPR